MDTSTLVGADLATGSEVVQALDSAGYPIQVALMMKTPDYDDERLVVASKAFDQHNSIRAYEQVALALQNKFARTLPSIMILKMSDPFVRSLRRVFAKTARVDGMRLGGQMFGNRLVSDGYVYRIR